MDHRSSQNEGAVPSDQYGQSQLSFGLKYLMGVGGNSTIKAIQFPHGFRQRECRGNRRDTEGNRRLRRPYNCTAVDCLCQ